MNVAAGLTPTQCAAHERHLNFQKSISDRATALKKAKMESAVEEMLTALRAEIPPAPAPIEPSPAAAPQKSDCWFVPAECARNPTIAAIQEAVCKHYKVNRLDLISPRRGANVVRPRQVAYYIAKLLTVRTLPEIGRSFGGRDHTTVLHGIRKITGLLAEDAGLASDVAVLIEQIKGVQ